MLVLFIRQLYLTVFYRYMNDNNKISNCIRPEFYLIFSLLIDLAFKSVGTAWQGLSAYLARIVQPAAEHVHSWNSVSQPAQAHQPCAATKKNQRQISENKIRRITSK